MLTIGSSIFASRKLVPFLAAQETFKAQAEAKYLANELEAKLAPAEAIVGQDRGRLEDRFIWLCDEKAFQILQRKHGGAEERKDVFVYTWALAVALAVRCSFLKTIGCHNYQVHFLMFTSMSVFL